MPSASASVQAMSRSSAPASATRPPIIHSRTSYSTRDQAHDLDDATLNAIFQSPVDRKAFVRAQQDALDAINDAALARAIEASKETAALEGILREQSQPVASTSRAAQEQIPQLSTITTSSNPGPASSMSQSADDEAAARELARSWRVDHLQPVLLNPPSAPIPIPTRAQAVSTASAAAGRSADAHSRSLHRSPSAAPAASSSSKSAVASSSKGSTPTASSSGVSAVAGSSRKPVPSSSSRPPLSSSASAAAAALSSSPPKATSRPPLRSAVTDTSVTTRTYAVVAPPTRPPLPRPSQRMSSASAAASAHASRQLSRGVLSSSSSSTSPARSNSTSPGSEMSPPMKRLASVSTRELHTGTLKNPGKENVYTQSEYASPSGYSPEQEPPEILEIFKASRNCELCGVVIASPRPLLLRSEAKPNHLTNLLHVQCSSCAANHCRGCFSLIGCPRNCDGGEGCLVKSCCSQVRAIAIFDALRCFDDEYATEAILAGRDTKADRQNYLTRVLESKETRVTQRFEKALIPTLRTICSWLQLSDDDGKFHPSVQRLFALSYLPEVIHAFLNHKNLAHWVSLSESYIEILEVLRLMGECGLSQLLAEPLPNIEQSCGLQCRIWDGGRIIWESNGRNEFVYSRPLSERVKELREHRRLLMDLAGKATFQSTMDKAHALRDSIAHLLMQQVVSG